MHININKYGLSLSFYFLFIFFLFSQNSFAIVVAGQGPANAMQGSGGSAAGGQSIQTDEFTGAATYSVTLPVPPARGGIEPQVVLNYSSYNKNPNSWVGYGWDLDMGAIERTPTDGVVDYYAGTNFQARFGGQNEALTLVGQDLPPSNYHLSLAAGYHVDLYRAKIESAFNYYFHLTDGMNQDDGWIVIDKSGRTYTFGQAAYAKEEVEHEYASTSSVQTWISKWLLEKVTDANGNELIINYGIDNLPSTITYQDINITFHKVYGDYSYYPSYREVFSNMNRLGTRLVNIEISQNGNRLQKFALTYTSSVHNNFTYMTMLQQSGTTDASTLPATTFQYYGEAGDDSVTAGPILAATSDDYHGPGISGGFPSYSLQIIDMNGDGLPDLVQGAHDSKYVYYNNGHDFVDVSGKTEWSEPFDYDCTARNECTGSLNVYYTGGRALEQWIYFMDMNGDGLPDRVYAANSTRGDDQHRDFLIALNTGSSWSTTLLRWHDPVTGDYSGLSDNDRGFADMNGDALPDRIVGESSRQGFYVYYNTGAGFESTAHFWKDPKSVGNGDMSCVGKLSKADGENTWCYIRDMNGDGLPDRVWTVDMYHGSVSPENFVGTGIHVALNHNGVEWAQPDVDPTEGAAIYDKVDNFAILDPSTDSDSRGYINSTHDWIDLNGDGYLDRIEGNTATGIFHVWYFNGISISETYVTLSNEVDYTDPVTNVSGEWSGMGYVSKSEIIDDVPLLHTFFMDINGDGYPDRVKVRRAEDNDYKYEVYPLKVNTVTYSDSPTTWLNQDVPQPMGALKSLQDGQGGKLGIEYQPSTWPTRFSTESADIPRNHRFLPFNVFVAHKLYSLDYSMPADTSVEAVRWPGMRWTTYNYSGGNFFVHNAVNTNPTEPALGTTTSNHYSQFNGFQTVTKQVHRAPSETWDDLTTTSVYQQAEGDVNPVSAADASLFVSAAYGHFSLSGKPYSSTVATTAQTLVTETSAWSENHTTSGELYACTNDICLPQLSGRIKTVYEEGSTTPRVSSVAYTFDATTGNPTSEVYRDGNGNELLTKTTTFYSDGDFDPALHIRDRPSAQTQTQGGVTYRQKTFNYDLQGNPTAENFYTDATNFVSMNRTFNPDGTLHTITDIDGVTKTVGYDADALFPTSESVTLPSGTTLTTTRGFNRLNGQVNNEKNAYNIGSSTENDDFGRPLNESIINASGTATLDKTYSYEYVTATVENLANVTLMKTEAWVPQTNYADTSTNPAVISYSDGSGYTLQKCTYTERGDYRMVQSRQSNGGRYEVSTEPVFSSACDFLPTIASSAVTYTTTKDYQGRPIAVNPPPGDAESPMGSLIFHYAVNSDQQLVKTTTTSDGRTKIETFDANERIVKVTDPNGVDLNYHYNAVGDLETFAQNSTTLTTMHYDQLGRKDDMIDADMGTWHYEYNAAGFLEKQTDNKGQYLHQDYDAMGRLTRKESHDTAGALEKYELYSYDSGDGAHDVQPGELFKVEEFDAAGNSLRTTEYSYDTNYRRIAKITRTLPEIGDLEQTVTNDYRGVLQSTSYPGGENLYYNYDRLGNIQELCNTSNCDTTSGEIYYAVDPSSGYDVYGNLLRENFGDGVTSDYAYYPRSHRMQEKKIYNGANIYSERQYQYDIYSNLMAITDPLSQTGSGGLSDLSYDSLNRLTGYKQVSASTPVILTYDDKGNILTNSRYGESTYEYTSSRPHAVTKIGADTFDYDDNGNMTSDSNRTMVYNAKNQLSQVTMKNGNVAQYEYDYTGARVKKITASTDAYHTTTTRTTHYLGDAIEIAEDRVILHIAANNQQVATKSLGTITDILSSGGGTFRNVNINPNFGLPVALPYIAMLCTFGILLSFRPVRAPLPRPLGAALPSPRFGGRVVGDRERGFAWHVLHSYSAYTQAMFHALHRLPRNFAVKMVSLILIFFTLVNFPLKAMAGDTGTPRQAASDENYFYYSHGDHLGSNHILTEGSHDGGMHSGILYNRGTLLQRIEFAPFGQESFVLNPNLTFDPRYTGQEYDVETGLYYYNARYYNPVLARFIQPDTVVPSAKDLQAYNRYSYVANNPLKYVDPSGHGFLSFFKKIIGTVVTIAVGVALNALAPGLGSVALAMIAGAAGGLIGGAVNGGLSGALLGALMGGISGAAFGGIAQGISNGLVDGGLKQMTAKWTTRAIMGAIGAGVIVGSGGGWEGLLTFGITFAASIAVGEMAGGAKTTTSTNSKYHFEYGDSGSPLLASNEYTCDDKSMVADFLTPSQNATAQAISAASNSANVGYFDFNVSLPGVTFGEGIDSLGHSFIYAGFSFASPGIAFTASPDSISLGWNFGVQAGYFAGGQVGINSVGESFWEAGIVSPGVSLSAYYVWHLPNAASNWQ